MDARLNLYDNALMMKFGKYINSAGRLLHDQVDRARRNQELVKLRASQINGCAMCIDIHTKEAAAGRGKPAPSQPCLQPGARRQSLPRLAGGSGACRAGHPHRRHSRRCH